MSKDGKSKGGSKIGAKKYKERVDRYRGLLDEGRLEEAQALLKEMDEPTEFIGGPVAGKRRGRLVVLDDDGNWVPKNPPRNQ